MGAVELLEELQSCGVSVSLDQDELVLCPGSQVPPDLIPILKQSKPLGISHVPDWLNPFELLALPNSTSENAIIIQGLLQKGTGIVSITPSPIRGTTQAEHGRFAAEVPLEPGFNLGRD